MRIISGLYRARRLLAPEGLHTRPTPEKVREAVFSMLMLDIPDAHVLDIFAGSGAMALEALSRGAQDAVLIESNAAAQKAILGNMRALGTGKEANLMAQDYKAALLALQRAGAAFDVVFMDPPYEDAQALAANALSLLREYALLAPGAVISVEHEEAFLAPEGFHIYKEKRYGRARISLLEEQGHA